MSNAKIEKIKPKKISQDTVEEPKIYINFYCCHLSLNIIYTISYVTAAVLLNIVNRLVFYRYLLTNIISLLCSYNNYFA